MKSKREWAIGYDCDGVLASFDRSYVKLLKKLQPGIAPTGDRTWDIGKWVGATKETENAAWETIKSSRQFWVDLEPLASKQEFEQISAFAEWMPSYIITSRPDGVTYSTVDSTIWWMEKHGITNLGAIVADDKAALVKPLGLRFYIDDKPEHVNDVAEVMNQYHSMPFVCAFIERPYTVGAEVSPLATRVRSVAEFLDVVYGMIKDQFEEEDEATDET